MFSWLKISLSLNPWILISLSFSFNYCNRSSTFYLKNLISLSCLLFVDCIILTSFSLAFDNAWFSLLSSSIFSSAFCNYKFKKTKGHISKVEKLSMIANFPKLRKKSIRILPEIQTDSKICLNSESQETLSYTLQYSPSNVLKKHQQVYTIVPSHQESILDTTNHTR